MNYTRYEKVNYSFKLKESDLATSWATDFEIMETWPNSWMSAPREFLSIQVLQPTQMAYIYRILMNYIYYLKKFLHSHVIEYHHSIALLSKGIL